jgi:succinate dehydrogenase / fumarate reductase cytochrome b subunit
MYAVQRWTGLIAFAFIGWHVYTERFLTHGKSTYADVEHALANPYYFVFYLIGVTSCCIHLGNGVWNFLCKWGLAVTARAQRAAGYLGAVVAVTLSVVGVVILLGFRFDWHPFSGYLR